MKLVYIAGKYRANTEWGLEQNIRQAEDAAIKLWQQGYVVFCPHKNTAHFGGVCPDSVWLDGDLEILKRCDVIYMLKGWRNSKGATAELELAKKLNGLHEQTLSGARYLLIKARGGPEVLKRDNNNRVELFVNFEIIKERD